MNGVNPSLALLSFIDSWRMRGKDQLQRELKNAILPCAWKERSTRMHGGCPNDPHTFLGTRPVSGASHRSSYTILQGTGAHIHLVDKNSIRERSGELPLGT